MKILAARFTLALLGAVCLMFGQTKGPVVGVGPFLHIVSDLDQSLAFYHDTLGLEISGPAGAEHKFTDNAAVANLYGVPGKQFRAAVLKIPGSEMGIELVQWGEARKPKGKSIAGPGAVTLVLRMKETATRVTHDPDGFPVEMKQSGGPGADLSVSVSDGRKAAALYDTVLGLKPDRIQFTQTPAHLSGGASFPEPGDGMLRLFVHDITALTASLKSAGFSVITTGGAPVTLPQGPQVIIVRDPNNFYVQLMEAK